MHNLTRNQILAAALLFNALALALIAVLIMEML